MQNLSCLVLRVFLQGDAGDQVAGEVVEEVEAALDVVDEDDGVFEGIGALVADFGGEELAAEQGGDAAGFEGEAKESAQETSGLFAIEPEIGTGNVAGFGGIAAGIEGEEGE